MPLECAGADPRQHHRRYRLLLCYRLGGYEGALLGLALVPALVVIPAAFMLMRRGNVPLSYLKPQWDKILAGSSVSLP